MEEVVKTPGAFSRAGAALDKAPCQKALANAGSSIKPKKQKTPAHGLQETNDG
jgi:hypothetical protein